MFGNKGIIYKFKGQEREQLLALQRAITSARGAFMALLQDAIKRESIPAESVFDSDRLVFTKKPPTPPTKKAE